MKYKHYIHETVKFHEVDMLGVCNNAVYFNYFEDARIAYLRDLKEKYSLKEVMGKHSFFIMAHNEIDYYEPAYLEDALLVHSKIDFVKKSSFGFSHLVAKGDKIIAEGGGVMVHINTESRKSVKLPDEFYKAVKDFEEDVKLL